MTAPSVLVPIPVSFLSGRTAIVQLRPSDTVAELERRVEEELDVPCFHEAQLSLGLERLRRDLPVADLAERLKGRVGRVEAVVGPSAPKAFTAIEKFTNQQWDCMSEYESMSAVAKECAPALNILIEQNVDVENTILRGLPNLIHYAVNDAIELSGECESCRQFATMFLILKLTRVHDGCRQLKDDHFMWYVHDSGFSRQVLALLEHEEFDQFVIPAIRNPIGFAMEWEYGEEEALRWLAEEHPRAAVRAAASEKIGTLLTPAAAAARLAVRLPEGEAVGGAAAAREAPAAAHSAEAAAASTEQEANELAEAVSISDHEALQQEGQQVIEAVMRSKADQWNADGVVLARLTCYRPDAMDFLRGSEHLAACRARVADAGCEQSPAWAGGAPLLVPATREQISEAGIDLRPHHVLMLSDDKELVQQALSELPRRARPKLMPEYHPEWQGAAPREPCGVHGTPLGAEVAGQEAGTAAPPASYAGAPEDEVERHGAPEIRWREECGIEVERTFLSFALVKDVTEASEFTESAPACPGEPSGGDNPRRWRARSGKLWPSD